MQAMGTEVPTPARCSGPTPPRRFLVESRSLGRGGPLSLVVRVRHEGVAETVLLFAKEVTTPAVLPAVSSRGVRPWQRGGAKPSAQRTLILRDGSPGVSRSCDCQHQGGWGPGVRGTANPGEPPQAPSQRTSPRC